MLQNIRNNIQGTMAKVIIAIIIVPFAIFGVESLVGGSGSVPVATVNDVEISEVDLQQAINIQKRRLLAMMGENIQPSMLDDAALRGPALDSLINQNLLQQGAADLDLSVSPQALDQAILGMAAFQENGRFSADRYQALLREQGYTPTYFKQMLRQELVVNQLHNGVASSEFVTPQELQRVTGLLQQQRSFSYITLPIDSFKAQLSVTDADIQTYYAANKSAFLSEERVRPEYIELRLEDYFQPVDEAAIQAEYDREMAEFSAATERHAAHILVEINDQRDGAQAQALAASLQAKIAAGEDFAQLAAQYSDDLGSKSSGGDLGSSSGDAFPTEFEQALSQLEVGAVSAPVKSESGYHLIKLLDKQVKEKPAFEERKAEIAVRLQRDKAQPELIKAVEKLRDLVFNSDGLGGPAKELQLPVKEGGWIDRKSTDPLLGNPRIITALFTPEVLKDGNNSEVIELRPDHYVVLRAKQHEEAAPRPLDEVKAVITQSLVQERAEAAAKALAAEFAEPLRQGDDLERVAAQRGYTAKRIENAIRGNAEAAPELLRAVFGITRPLEGKPLPIDTIALSNGDVALVQLRAVREGKTDSLNPAQRSALVGQMEQGLGTANFAALMENFRSRAEVVKAQ